MASREKKNELEFSVEEISALEESRQHRSSRGPSNAPRRRSHRRVANTGKEVPIAAEPENRLLDTSAQTPQPTEQQAIEHFENGLSAEHPSELEHDTDLWVRPPDEEVVSSTKDAPTDKEAFSTSTEKINTEAQQTASAELFDDGEVGKSDTFKIPGEIVEQALEAALEENAAVAMAPPITDQSPSQTSSTTRPASKKGSSGGSVIADGKVEQSVEADGGEQGNRFAILLSALRSPATQAKEKGAAKVSSSTTVAAEAAQTRMRKTSPRGSAIPAVIPKAQGQSPFAVVKEISPNESPAKKTTTIPSKAGGQTSSGPAASGDFAETRLRWNVDVRSEEEKQQAEMEELPVEELEEVAGELEDKKTTKERAASAENDTAASVAAASNAPVASHTSAAHAPPPIPANQVSAEQGFSDKTAASPAKIPSPKSTAKEEQGKAAIATKEKVESPKQVAALDHTQPQIAAPLPSPDAARGTKRKKSWFEEIFDEDWLRTINWMTPKYVGQVTDFIVQTLQPTRESQLLDLGCGDGRFAAELASKGYQVTGYDLSLPLLIKAAENVQRRNIRANFIHGDFRELTFEEQFDAAYCIHSSFGYFDDDTNRKMIHAINRALRVGGRLLLEVFNRDYSIRNLPARIWWEGEGCVVLEEVEFDYFTSRFVSKRSVVFEDGRHIEQEISIRSYSLHELGKILHHAGFRVLEVSGHLAHRARFYGNHSRSLIILAEKKDTHT